MRKTLAVLAFLAMAGVASAQPVMGAITPIKVQPVSTNINAANGSVAFAIKYFPPAGGGSTSSMTPKVAVEADGNLTFTVAGSAYTGFELPVSGALGGVIDVSDAEANTAGEVCDAINSTPITFATGYFRCALVNALRSDDVSAATTLLADAADTEVARPDLGELVYFESAGLDDDEIGFYDTSKGASAFIGDRDVPRNGAFDNINSVVQFARANVTNAGTVGDFTIYAVKETYITGRGCNAAGDCGQGSEVVRTIAVFPAATATEVTSSTAFPQGMLARGEKVFGRVDSSGADTSVWSLQMSGYVYPQQ